MPQLHHRDPSIIGLLGASPSLPSPFEPIASRALEAHIHGAPTEITSPMSPASGTNHQDHVSEALNERTTPPQTPVSALKAKSKGKVPELTLGKSYTADKFVRPFYELIVDGIHSHPNSVRVILSSIPIDAMESNAILSAGLLCIPRRMHFDYRCDEDFRP